MALRNPLKQAQASTQCVSHLVRCQGYRDAGTAISFRKSPRNVQHPFFHPSPGQFPTISVEPPRRARGTTTSHQAQLLNHGVASGDGSLGRRSRGRLRFPAVTIHATAATASRVGAVALWVSAGVSDAGRHTWRRSPHALRLWPCCRRGSCCSRGLGRSGPGAHDAATGGHASATPKVCFFAGWKRWCVLKVVLGQQQIDTYCSRCWDTPWPWLPRDFLTASRDREENSSSSRACSTCRK